MLKGDGTLQDEGRNGKAHCIFCDAGGDQATGESSQHQRHGTRDTENEMEAKRRRRSRSSGLRREHALAKNRIIGIEDTIVQLYMYRPLYSSKLYVQARDFLLPRRFLITTTTWPSIIPANSKNHYRQLLAKHCVHRKVRCSGYLGN